MSRHQFKPTEDQRFIVRTLAGQGMRQTDIAALMLNPHSGKPITDKTLREHFRYELDAGKAAAVSDLTEKAHQIALNDARGPEQVRMLIFLLKTQGRFSEERFTDEAPGNEARAESRDDARARLFGRLCAIADRAG